MARQETIQKSVRLPVDLVEFVEKYEGRDFSKKLVNILNEFQSGEEQRQRRIEQYDLMIEERRRRLDEVTECLNRNSVVARSLESAERTLAKTGL